MHQLTFAYDAVKWLDNYIFPYHSTCPVYLVDKNKKPIVYRIHTSLDESGNPTRNFGGTLTYARCTWTVLCCLDPWRSFRDLTTLNPGIQDFFIADTLSHVSSGWSQQHKSRIWRMASLLASERTEKPARKSLHTTWPEEIKALLLCFRRLNKLIMAKLSVE